MAAKTKKNKAIKASKNEANGKSTQQPEEIPQEVLKLIESYYRTNRKSNLQLLHHLFNTFGTTKTWIPATTRCHRAAQRPWPHLCTIDQYSTDTSPSTHPEEEAAMVLGHRIIKPGGYVERVRAIYGCTVVDPFDCKNGYMEFTSVVCTEDTMYALSLQGCLAVIDSSRAITGLSSNRAVPSGSSRFFKEYLVEMNGEVFVVFFIHEKSLEQGVDRVEVLRLCLDKVKWVKVERLQAGKTLFCDVQCVWVESAVIGCRDDCVYFTWGCSSSDDRWWIYDMKTGCFSHI